MKNCKEIEAMKHWHDCQVSRQQDAYLASKEVEPKNKLLPNVISFVLSFVTVFALINYFVGAN